MKKVFILSFVLFLASVINSGAQTFFKSYRTSGSNGTPMGYSYPTADSGLIFSVDSGIQRLDKTGSTVWARSIDAPSPWHPSPQRIITSSTGRFYANGWYNRVTTAELDSAWITKLSPTGTSIWSKLYRLYVWNTCPTDDGGFMMCGMLKEQVHFTDLNYIIRVDSDGNVVWKKQYTDTAMGYLIGIVPAHTAGNYVVMGGYTGLAAPNNFIHCFEIDGAGNVIWQKKYRTTADGMYNPYILQKHTNGYLLSSAYAGTAPGDASWKLGLVKIDSAGNVVWTGQYNDPTMLITQYSGMAANDAGNIMACAQYSSSSVYMYYMLDSTGNVAWGKTSTGVSGASTYGPVNITGIYANRFLMSGSGSITVPAAMIDYLGDGMCVSTPFTITRSTLPITTLPLSIAVADSPAFMFPLAPFATAALTYSDTTYCSSGPLSEPVQPVAPVAAKVYPNPATSVLYVEPGAEWQEVKLLGLTGAVVPCIVEQTNGRVQISTAGFPSGVYFVAVSYKSGFREMIKVAIID